MIKYIQLMIVSIMLVFATFCFAGKNDNPENNTRVVFVYDDHEYPAALFEKSHDDQSIPSELRVDVQPGDSLGYRRYEGNEIIEDVSGSLTEDGQIIFSNGICFLVKKMTLFYVLKKLKATLITFHPPNFGYLE